MDFERLFSWKLQPAIQPEFFELNKNGFQNSNKQIIGRVADQYALFKTFHGTTRNCAV
jgi:hypothetical protein